MKIIKSDWLSNRLRDLNKTKTALADVLGMRTQHVNRLLYKIKLKPGQLTELAKFLDVNEQNLMDFWDNKLSEQALFKEPYNAPRSQGIGKEDLILLLTTIDMWLKSIHKTMPIDKKVELAFLIYDEVKVVPAAQKRAEIIKLAEILNKVGALNVA